MDKTYVLIREYPNVDRDIMKPMQVEMVTTDINEVKGTLEVLIEEQANPKDIHVEVWDDQGYAGELKWACQTKVEIVIKEPERQ